MKFRSSAVRATLLTATALGCVVAACIGAPQAQAQFVCIGTVGGAVVIDTGATATGDSSMACGPFANATGVFATATGFNATANGLAATATGENSLANGTRANATGAGANAIGENATAIGTRSSAIGTNATALGGPGTIAQGTNATALGAGAVAAFAGSTAIGAGAVTTAPNQMAFGTAGSTYVAPGITSGASRAAQNGPLQIVTSDAGGNLATNTAAGPGFASLTDITGGRRHPERAAYLTSDNQMTCKPNLALNAEIESLAERLTPQPQLHRTRNRSPILRITPTSSLCGPIWLSAAWGECPCAQGAASSPRSAWRS